MSSPATEAPRSPAEVPSGLLSASFLGLLFTQFLTAVNDNVFRWLVIGVGKDYGDESQANKILVAGTVSFVLPYLILAAHAGYLADRFSKRSVIIGCKIAEIVIVAVGVAAIWYGQVWMLLLVVAMTGCQSALFAPSKLGAIPELLHPTRIPKANGLFGLMTVSATVIGMGIGSWLSDVTGHKGQERLWLSASVLLGVAIVGTILSFAIHRLQPANPSLKFPWDPLGKIWRDLRTLTSNRPLFRVALGIAFFWGVGSLAQMNVDQFAAEGGAESQSAAVPLLFALVLGVGLGSVLAGIWSGGRIELGLLPLGALGIAVCAMMMFTVDGRIIQPNAPWTAGFVIAAILLFGIGLSAGLFNVPLESYLQHRSDVETRGSVLAASNFLTFAAVATSAMLYGLMRYPLLGPQPLLSARHVFLVTGFFTIPVLIYIVCLIPQASIRFLVWLMTRTVYRVRVEGLENLPERGGALLIANHISWIDGVMLLVTSSRPIRMLAYAGNFQNRLMQWLGRLWGAILIGSGPKSIARGLQTAQDALKSGELVCIFPEGGISRTGDLLPFKPGVMRVIQGTDLPVIPVYLGGLWGSIFSFERGKFFWKLPKRVPYPVSIRFGKPITRPDDVQQLRRAVQELGETAVQPKSDEPVPLLTNFIRMCKKRCCTKKIADSMGQELSGGMLLMRTLILRRLLRRMVLGRDERHVGLLLPPSAGGFIANMAVSLDRRVGINLNYTVSEQVMNACIQQASIRHVLTSRKFMEKMNFKLDADVVYLDDFKDRVTLADKAIAAFQAFVLPAALLGWWLGAAKVRSSDLLTLIFTSGSTGTPKGVMLSYGNVMHNVQAIEQVVRLSSKDVILGILPYFHSFGYTVTMWTVSSIDVLGVYHFNPLDAQQVGKLCQKYGATIFLSTPTFLRSYLRRCEREQLQSLEVVVCGAEKLPKDLSDAFESKFGVRPMEGYGTTELSPLVSVNVPLSRASTTAGPVQREGSVGRPVPGVNAKIVDLDSGAELPPNQPGMLLISGPNVMQGYLNRPDLTAEVMRDGWYVTGDVAFLDEDGFIHITGRESRFSKIGGEMVPHIRIEEALAQAIADADDDRPKIAVTAVPDPKKGERLVVLHTKVSKSPDEFRKHLMDAGLPNLFLPSADSFIEVEELPILGSGKLDLKGIRQMALERLNS